MTHGGRRATKNEANRFLVLSQRHVPYALKAPSRITEGFVLYIELTNPMAARSLSLLPSKSRSLDVPRQTPGLRER